MKQTVEWWKQTANHVWRVYFSLMRNNVNPDTLSVSDHTVYIACDTVRRKLSVPSDIDILQMYYTTPKGMELHNVEDYSLRNNVPVHVIWNAIRHANRAVMEEIGLLDRRQIRKDASD